MVQLRWLAEKRLQQANQASCTKNNLISKCTTLVQYIHQDGAIVGVLWQ
jgi:hypothetical protein